VSGILLLCIGLGAGVLSGMFGIGGGVVIVPSLIYFMRFQATTATGTSLAALLLPVGAFGAWQYYRAGHINATAALWVSLGLLIGAGIGAKFALGVSSTTLQRMFAVFLVLVAIRMWFK
jgi:uncharacterized protein